MTDRSNFVRPQIKIDTDNASQHDVASSNSSLNMRASTPVRNLARRSVDSIASFASVATTTTTANGNRRFTFSMENKSGSSNYSPLGNNSIYEVVMNTRYKQWLQAPTNLDITPVMLSRNEIPDNWNGLVSTYVNTISGDAEVFVNRANIKNVNRLEDIRSNKSNKTEYGTANDSNIINEEVDVNEEENDVMNQVPEFYFEKSFSIENERIFKRILEGIDLNLKEVVSLTPNSNNSIKRGSENSGNGMINDNAYIELKDKLSDYLDVVESSLVSELSKSSPQFFYVLGEVDNIQKKVSDTVTDLDKMNTELKETQQDDISSRMENLRKIFKRRNVEKLEQGLLQVKLILNKVEECKELYANDDHDSSLDMIKSIDYLIRGDTKKNKHVGEWTEHWPYKLSDLKSVPALIETREFLTNMKIEIGGKLSIQLSDILLRDVRQHYQNVDVHAALGNLQNGYDGMQKVQEHSPELQSSLREIILKLNRCEELASAFSLYQAKSLTECKDIIKTYLPSAPKNTISPSISTEPSSTSLQNQVSKNGSPDATQLPTNTNPPKLSTLIRAQTPVEFQNMMIEIYTRCSEALRVLFTHQKVLLDIALDVVDSSGGEGGPSENQHNMITQLDIRHGINDIIGVIQLRMGKVLAVRKEVTSALRYDHFLVLYAINVAFIQECEALSGEFLTKYLSDSLASQIKHCISNRDSKNVRTIQKKIELENWQPYIVNPGFQKEVNEIVSSVDIDPIAWTSLIDLTTNIDAESGPENSAEKTEHEASNSAAATQVQGDNRGNRKSVVVGDNTFVASDSLLTTIGLIRELLILSINIPAVYLSYFEKLCFNLLKNFNNYTISLINQPGRSSKSSGKNLSIMAETLDCLAEFIGIVQKFYQRISNVTRDFTPYDPKNYELLKKQYQSSSEKIYAANAPPPPV